MSQLYILQKVLIEHFFPWMRNYGLEQSIWWVEKICTSLWRCSFFIFHTNNKYLGWDRCVLLGATIQMCILLTLGRNLLYQNLVKLLFFTNYWLKSWKWLALFDDCNVNGWTNVTFLRSREKFWRYHDSAQRQQYLPAKM